MSLSVFHQSNYKVVRYYMLTFNEWHLTKNKELTPEGFIHGSEKEVWWLHPKGLFYSCKIYISNIQQKIELQALHIY